MPQEKYQSCIDACNDCMVACEHCATECLYEQDVKMMARCIELDRCLRHGMRDCSALDGERFGVCCTDLRHLRPNLSRLRR